MKKNTLHFILLFILLNYKNCKNHYIINIIALNMENQGIYFLIFVY